MARQPKTGICQDSRSANIRSVCCIGVRFMMGTKEGRFSIYMRALSFLGSSMLMCALADIYIVPQRRACSHGPLSKHGLPSVLT